MLNMILAIHPEHAENILNGIKTVELRRRVPVQLSPGATIFLYHSGHIHGHCTYAGLNLPPPPRPLHDKWLSYISRPAAVPPVFARNYLSGAKQPCAILLRYPVRYKKPVRSTAACQSFIYTTEKPHIIHPSVPNYLLYLNTH